MRHVFAIFVTLFFLKTASFAQYDTTTVLKDSVKTVIIVPEQAPSSEQFNVILGVAPFPYSDLNGLLKKSRFGGNTEFTPRALGGSVFVGLGGQSVYEKWRLMYGLYIQPDVITRQGRVNPETGRAEDATVTFWSAGIEIGGGYHLFKTEYFALYPFLSMIPQINHLSVEEGVNDFFQSVDERFNNSTEIYNSITFVNTAFFAGVGTETIIDFSSLVPRQFRDLYPSTHLVFGIRGGYSFTTRPAERIFNGDPDFKSDGLRVNFQVGYSFPVKKYKAKIISEEE